jgi:hypothetical protein
MEMPKNHPGKGSIKGHEKLLNITYNWLQNNFLESEKHYTKESESFIKFTTEIETLLLKDRGIGVGNRLESQAERFISVFLHSGDKKNNKQDLASAADHLITSRLFRSLKNRYDLDKNNLSSFKNDYVDLFKKRFEYEPKFAIELLEIELGKK